MILKPVGLMAGASTSALEFIGFAKGQQTVSAHASTQEGDLVVALAYYTSSTAPTGATWVSHLNETSDLRRTRLMTVFAGASAVQWIDNATSGLVGLWTFRNANTSTPLGVIEYVASAGDIPYPAITAGYANSWIICMGAHKRNNINYATTSPNADLTYIAVEPTSGTDTSMAAWFDSDGISSGNAGGNVTVRAGTTAYGAAIQVEIRVA